ncbi:carboxypeptidase-like regulatory domain-containing protein [Hymenobacter tibetensis]|uniref:Carboxypeptidase-like regulatory domain-containing protein n=1 Tax=Hymenobacter tibetensis TaxID=497967 RepID=A0ABY4D274_9BACT|nr:carboxypeptidase-like regulatory domain-containing protein [Hymenobacter tibetensis]UOG75600.1 carboxypeptidase-like regulatory domain-containing protein [Hymenobacter tibetensis]
MALHTSLRVRLLLHSLAVLCLTTTAALAQMPATIRGTVADQTTGDLLLGATVRVAGQPASATATDLDGAFAVPYTPTAQPDTLVVSYVGYRPFRVVLRGVPAAPIAVRLVPASGLTLAQVEVTAKRPIAEDFIVRELDYLTIVTNPAAAADPLLAVRTLPAATTLDESASISLRGSDPTQTGIYLNNVPVYDAVKFAQLTGIGTFGIFSVDLVKSVLVFPSNPPLEFGNAGAGLISLTTDEQRRDKFVQASLGLANSGVLVGRPVGERGMFKAYVNAQNGQLLRAVNPASFRQLTRFGLVDGGAHFATKIGEYGTFKAFGYGLSERYAYRPSAGSPEAYRYRNLRGFYTLSYEQAWPHADLALSHGLGNRRAEDALGNYRTTRRFADYYAAAHYRRYWFDALSTRVGVSYDERRLHLAGQFPVRRDDMSATAPTYAAAFGQGRTLWEAYQYTKFTRGPWVVGAGLRLNALPRPAQPGYGSAQLNMRRNLNIRSFLNLSGGQYTSFTSPDPVYYGFLRTRIRQVALDYSAGSASPDGAILTAAIYAKQERSVLRTNLLGAEVFGQRTFFKRLRADLAAATMHAAPTHYDAADPDARVLALAQRRYDVRFQLKSTLKLVGKWGELGAFAQYRAGAPFTPVLGTTPDPATGSLLPQYAGEVNADYLPNYFRADLTASKFIRRQTNGNTLVLYAVCSNILNIRNVSGYSYTPDYTQALPNYFQRRLLYFGVVKTWQ